MHLSDLYGTVGSAARHTVYVVGTGPSLRCLPLDYFDGAVTIGLNQSWRHLRTTLSITVHPELVLEYEQTASRHDTVWAVKRKPPLADLWPTHPAYYVFDTSYDINTIADRPDGVLYLGEGVQTTAMDLAARMGARFIVLVGCDAAALGGDSHAHDQHVRWLGLDPLDQYALYRSRTAEVRAALRPLQVAVMTLSPFIGATAAEEDYQRLRGELGLAALPRPRDTSPYTRRLPKNNSDRGL